MIQQQILNVMRCAIWYHLYNLKNVKNTHGGVLILVKLQASSLQLKLILLHRCFLRFLNCTNGTKSRNAPHIIHANKDIFPSFSFTRWRQEEESASWGT